MGSARLLIFLPFLLFAACGDGAREGPASPAGPDLPEWCYGTWELSGHGGGLSGEGDLSLLGKSIRMTLTRDRRLVMTRPGAPDRSGTFSVREGPTIFSEEPMLFLVCEELGMEQVIQREGEDGLLLSENHYDGFQTSYRRVE